jgi:predicted nucleic acid-binding protein
MTFSVSEQVVFDSCVLLPPSVCDLFLRMAERPRLYKPRWSFAILDEVHKNQIGKFNYSRDLADYWRSEVMKAFQEAVITGFDSYLTECTNDEKDRHVLAAAIASRVDCIVTFNLKHFPRTALEPWKITATDPAHFVLHLYEMKPTIVLSKIDDMSRERNRSRNETLIILRKTMPSLVDRIASELEIELP